MISKLSEQLAERMFSSDRISDEDKELYIYGLFMLLSQLMFFIIVSFFGVILNCILESILFYIAFQLIRRHAGGYHAKTETRCEVMTTLSILACIVVISLSKSYDFETALLVISTISAVCIFVLCPLDTPEKPLSENEFKYFRKISWLILSVIFLVVIISYFVRLKWLQIFFAPCCLSLILECILLVAGKLKRSTVESKVL